MARRLSCAYTLLSGKTPNLRLTCAYPAHMTARVRSQEGELAHVQWVGNRRGAKTLQLGGLNGAEAGAAASEPVEASIGASGPEPHGEGQDSAPEPAGPLEQHAQGQDPAPKRLDGWEWRDGRWVLIGLCQESKGKGKTREEDQRS